MLGTLQTMLKNLCLAIHERYFRDKRTWWLGAQDWIRWQQDDQSNQVQFHSGTTSALTVCSPGTQHVPWALYRESTELCAQSTRPQWTIVGLRAVWRWSHRGPLLGLPLQAALRCVLLCFPPPPTSSSLHQLAPAPLYTFPGCLLSWSPCHSPDRVSCPDLLISEFWLWD